jgi:hypothetical protein
MKATLLYRVLFLLPGMAPRRRRQECAGHFGLTRLRLLCSAIRGFDDELQILRPPASIFGLLLSLCLGWAAWLAGKSVWRTDSSINVTSRIARQ